MEPSLLDLLHEQARLRPDDTAVVSGDDRMTYRELVQRSSELASRLRGLGITADDCVALFVEPSVDLMVGVWGILFAGGAYLPLSPDYPPERLRYMVEDSGAKVIVSHRAAAGRAAELAAEGTVIVALEDTGNPGGAGVVTAADPSSLAYVIYTSGSTGKPKGVMIEHRSIVSQMRWLAAAYGLNQSRTVLQKTPMSFDAAQWEILAPAVGAAVVMGGKGIYRDPERIIDTIRTHDVTTLQCVPTLLQALLNTDELSTCATLAQIFVGGEAFSEKLAQQCFDALPFCELVNLYGPTECTINSSAYTVERAALGGDASAISIGTPVHGTEYHVLDHDGSPVAVGEVGELYIGGIQVARGYIGQPEQTARRFVDNPFGGGKLFRTGDLVSWNADATVQFVGRADNQVKLHGFRVELDEIRLAIETHHWVRHAAVIVKVHPRTGFKNLVACVELNPKEAALMDQGNHAAHHQSKESRLQVRAQLTNGGVRDAADISGRPVTDLPGADATEEQRRQAFARKTYRFYDGSAVTKSDILRLLDHETSEVPTRGQRDLSFGELGEILRCFGQHVSPERLLPKYAYASPGSLYATQLYLEIAGIGALRAGIYYYHPINHQLVLINETVDPGAFSVKAHFVGRKRAIEPIYQKNIREVLEIETGHMVGLFEEVLPSYGFDIIASDYAPAVKNRLDVAEEDHYLGTFKLIPYSGPRPDDSLDVYVQAHPGKVTDLPAGQYAYADGRLELISSELIERRHVIAINQAVYDRASVGITVISRAEPAWRCYIDLGRKLQRLSMNDLNLGFMSSGYSSQTGDDLPSAIRIDSILKGTGRETGPSYFFVGGGVSDQQRLHEGMNEDVVHMSGPAEMIRNDLLDFLPDYMIPHKVVVLDKLPTTPNGKIDLKALAASDSTDVDVAGHPFVAPHTAVERRIAELWQKAMKLEHVSVRDDFFAAGGNSLIAVGLITAINREFAISLPLQVLFESPTIEQLADRVSGSGTGPVSRLVPLRPEGAATPVYCWPGLGGYTMNLQALARNIGADRPFYGVQAYGINPGEEPYATIREMAAEDVDAIRKQQPEGPYALWGYSFGARVAFEAAYQLEQLGEKVDHVVLIAPGAPKIDSADEQEQAATYVNRTYVTVLFSVFAGAIDGPLLEDCLAATRDRESFVGFIGENFTGLDVDTVRRIVRVVERTFEFSYSFRELAERKINAPIAIFKATGDDYSFLESSGGYSAAAPAVVDLGADHYSILRDPDVGDLATAIRRHLDFWKERVMPHINVKHFPAPLTPTQHARLISALTKAMTNAFDCDEGAVSIAFEPIDKEVWNEKVYVPEIVNRWHTLGKVPNYEPEGN
ncbi:amino acid adenylation domain-containing protein [Actinosynnema sp. ALI-1.44]|uniref:amino acid adenylation domain-containing protein n=1 Tax=Actinosynnema sp. ALI-1.44 TaxID=1933779 RepID=UPI00192D1808|nr:amino acid adenylation domain-containing protein [Actinosynnema sp. ALI-1.44]